MRDLAAASARAAPPPKVHVLVRKEDIDPSRLAGRVVIVLDILFATTTIVTALNAGATAVIPAETPNEARRIAVLTDPVVEKAIDAMPRAKALQDSAKRVIVQRLSK